VPRRSDSRERMVAAAAHLLRTQGYAATGWRQVVAESGAPWGSQAHHFPGGKQQLAADALAVAAARVTRGLQRLAGGAHPADAVLLWAEQAAAELEASGYATGCPVATVVLETAHTSDALAAAGSAALDAWRDALAGGMARHGADVAEARALATVVLAGVEGGLLLARAARDPSPLRTVATELAALLRARLPVDKLPEVTELG
jgi:TetR/AcrR family transcriptional regulator, lmrAB and yxaGH operons repressor